MKKQTIHHIDCLVDRFPELKECLPSIQEACTIIEKSFRSGGRLLTCGNGGSAADSLHIVGELMKGFVLSRPIRQKIKDRLAKTCPETADYLSCKLQGALPAISLVSETALFTAYSNDQTAELCFAQQVFGQGKQGDVLLAISTSGNSANVLYAAQVARALEISVVGLTGQDGGRLKKWCDVLIAVPERETFKIQELHLPVYHALCLALEEEFFGENE